MDEICKEHSGMIQKLDSIEKHALESRKMSNENCKKLDNLKILLITLLGGVVVQLVISIANGGS